MDKIKVKLVSHDDLAAVATACKITRSMGKVDDIYQLKNDWSKEKIQSMLEYPHSKLGRFTDFNFLILGASRRFLSQIITHHVGCDLISGSLQYSDMTNNTIYANNMFVVPYSIICKAETEDENGLINTWIIDYYIKSQLKCLETYESLREHDIDNDTAGYVMPMASRNNIYLKVNLEELRFIANQRLCRRNTDETRYIVGLMVEEVIKATGLKDELFMPTCHDRPCPEGRYSCGCPVMCNTIKELLDIDFANIRNA